MQEATLQDGAGHKPAYNLRTLCRALEYAAQATPTYGLQVRLGAGAVTGTGSCSPKPVLHAASQLFRRCVCVFVAIVLPTSPPPLFPPTHTSPPQRALWDGFAMSFLTQLDPASGAHLEKLMQAHLLGPATSLKVGTRGQRLQG